MKTNTVGSVIRADDVDDRDLQQLDQAVESLPSGSALAPALKRVIDAVKRGVDVSVSEQDTPLTPVQAAQMLRMSRTHLYKLLDAGVIDSYRVGRDRRIPVAAVVLYVERRSAQQAELAERFAHAGRDRAALVDEIAATM